MTAFGITLLCVVCQYLYAKSLVELSHYPYYLFAFHEKFRVMLYYKALPIYLVEMCFPKGDLSTTRAFLEIHLIVVTFVWILIYVISVANILRGFAFNIGTKHKVKLSGFYHYNLFYILQNYVDVVFLFQMVDIILFNKVRVLPICHTCTAILLISKLLIICLAATAIFIILR